MTLPRKARSILKWTGIVLGGLIGFVVLALAVMPWNAFKGPIERVASAHSGRTVSIAGPLHVQIWSLAPKVTVAGLTVGGPPWDKPPTVRLERLEVQLALLPLLKGDVVLKRVAVLRPQIYLHREASGRANWTFESTRPSKAPAGAPPKLPAVRDLLVQEGVLILHDELLHLDLRGTVQAHEQGAHRNPKAFLVQGKGTLNKEPFELNVAGGPLVNLDPDHPYPFSMQISAGDMRVSSDGIVRKPFNLGQLAFNVHANGSDLADVYYLTHLALPNTPPYQLSAHIDRDEKQIRVTDLAGKLGQSDIRGEVSVDASRKRPTVRGTLTSKQLRLRDMVASFGAKPKGEDSLHGGAEKAKLSKGEEKKAAPPNARLFPTARLQVKRVRAMDADVRFSAQSIEAGPVPIKEVAVHVQLDDGLLTISPLEFDLPQGRISGTAHIDARGETPQARVDMRVSNVQLDQLKGKTPNATPPLGGTMQGRAQLEGRGDSVHDVLADSNGRISAIIPHGEIRSAFAELAGIDLAKGLGLLFTNNRAEIRCGIAQFGVRNGIMRTEQVVLDTDSVRITGSGEILLGPEEMHLAIKGQPKGFRLVRLRTPIDISGHLRKPSIGVNVGKTVEQGAIAAALAATLTPFAAIAAFVDPGLAKDENCAALITGAKKANPGIPSKSKGDHPASGSKNLR